MNGERAVIDPLTQASVTIAWIILLNKPFYPLYVWYLAGNGVIASLATLIAAPFYLAIPLIAHRSSLAARVALPVIGTLDTLFETKLFGQGSGTELFFAACIMLAALSFRDQERWWQRGVAVVVFGVFMISRSSAGSPLYHWSDQDLAAFFNLNTFAAASLTTFIALRYAGSRDRGT
ncbi:hypothetical protein GAO09_06580 [Rhizobiales bacterium RZME27]|uniref:Uncharacterized protein n=1 Tax=Endobacterium cereale TaxID=2663029 RepID=A0A6A8A3G9_9HYPH|nr:hypothetical protein [Endobacterium cereale]MQY45725.1 hypothetical protein [Endobacterium cereale]